MFAEWMRQNQRLFNSEFKMKITECFKDIHKNFKQISTSTSQEESYEEKLEKIVPLMKDRIMIFKQKFTK